MKLTTQKRIAAELLGCGLSRVRITQEKDVEEAITREDVRQLIKKGLIKKASKKGTSRAQARQLLKQKARGRRRGAGSKKGRVSERKSDWIKNVRAQRRLLSENRQSLGKEYGVLYGRVKGGMFRSKKHLLTYMKERELLETEGGRTRKVASGKSRRST